MGKIEETSLHLVHPYKWKTSHVVSIRQLDSQLCTEFGTHVKKSVPFPVVTPAMTDCLIKQRPQFITLMNSWLSHQWRGDDIHTDRAHFQRTSSQRQRGRESFIDLGQSCYSHCCRVSATCNVRLCSAPFTTTCLPRQLSLSSLVSHTQKLLEEGDREPLSGRKVLLAFRRGETNHSRFI